MKINVSSHKELIPLVNVPACQSPDNCTHFPNPLLTFPLFQRYFSLMQSLLSSSLFFPRCDDRKDLIVLKAAFFARDLSCVLTRLLENSAFLISCSTIKRIKKIKLPRAKENPSDAVLITYCRYYRMLLMLQAYT